MQHAGRFGVRSIPSHWGIAGHWGIGHRAPGIEGIEGIEGIGHRGNLGGYST